MFEQVCESIQKDIAARVLKEGDKLPSEREIAERLGFSRSAVREAIRALEATGILRLQKGVNGGAFIRKADGSAVAQSMQDVVLRGELSLHDLTEVRVQLLVAAVALAVRRRTPADLRALNANIEITAANLEVFEETRDQNDIIEPIANFSKLIGAATKNKLLSMLIDAVTDIQMRAFAALDMPFSSSLLDSRREIVRRIAARDSAGATEEMIRYLAVVHEAIHSFVKENAPEHLAPWLPPEVIARAPKLSFARSDGARHRVHEKSANGEKVKALEQENFRLKMLLAEAMLDLRAAQER